MIVVSACLLGKNCKYDGGNNRCEAVLRLVEGKEVMMVCPETEGGLRSPRYPSEKRDGKVFSKSGEDVTEAFEKGAEKCLDRVLERIDDIEFAVLKANSPSCGSGKIYDGSFTGKLKSGDGVFTEKLKTNGIRVITEKEL